VKLVAVHDAKGAIHRLVLSPANAPAGAVVLEPGLAAVEVEAADLQLDPADERFHERLTELAQQFRVEVRTEARLVRKAAATD
jgi:hypothetical protein